MTLSLAGDWRYSTEDHLDFARPTWDDSTWQTMYIPQNWFLGGLNHHGVVWFRHEFNFMPKDVHARLHFDGVDYFADVYLNGSHLGRHIGYFEPFSFDVTNVLQPGKNNLAVRVDSPFEQPGLDGWHIRKRLIKGILNHHDCRPGGGWNPEGQSYNTGGIWNKVYIEEHGAVTIEEILLRAELESQPPILNVQMRVINRTAQQEMISGVHCVPENFKGDQFSFETTISIPQNESLQTIRLPIPRVALWQPWDRGFPHLYKVTLLLSSGGKEITTACIFGFRTVKVDEGFRWFINEKPYFVRGSNYIGSQWLSETLFPEAVASKTHPFGSGPGKDLFQRDVALAKQANLNMLRVHAHVLPAVFHEACDRAGMLAWQDFPLQWGYSDDPDFQVEAVRQMRAMLKLLSNHPSIVAWCCHNESPWDAPWMAGAVGEIHDPDHNRLLDMNLHSAAREMDPTRYVHLSSGTGDGHAYPGWYEGHWRDFRDLPGAPFITEYGAQGLPIKESLQHMLPQFGPDAGFSELSQLKTWIESHRKISQANRLIIKLGFSLFKFMEKHPTLKKLKGIFMEWGIKRGQSVERSIYQNLPTAEEISSDLRHARQVWQTWLFHDTQLMETFENGIETGNSLDDFIKNSQAYQAHLIQFGTECYRRAKYTKVTGIVQFDFTDPWPAVTWSVLDYWRHPKASFDALQRSMQPVLPSLLLPENFKIGKIILVSFRVINDLEDSFPEANCAWQLTSNVKKITSASFTIAIPSDGVSDEVKVALPPLEPGLFRLDVLLNFGERILGQNYYEFTVKPK